MLEQDTQIFIFRQQPEKAQQSQQCNVIFKPLRNLLGSVSNQCQVKTSKLEIRGKRGERRQEGFLLSLYNLVINLLVRSPHYFIPTSPILGKDTLLTITVNKKERNQMCSGQKHYQMKNLRTEG